MDRARFTDSGHKGNETSHPTNVNKEMIANREGRRQEEPHGFEESLRSRVYAAVPAQGLIFASVLLNARSATSVSYAACALSQ